jgi:hypothetical protein
MSIPLPHSRFYHNRIQLQPAAPLSSGRERNSGESRQAPDFNTDCILAMNERLIYIQ